MTIKYATYNALTGENVFHDTKEAALQDFWTQVVNYARSHWHNTAYTVVEQREDGSEVWYNDNNQEIESPKTAAEIEALFQYQEVPQQTSTNLTADDLRAQILFMESSLEALKVELANIESTQT